MAEIIWVVGIIGWYVIRHPFVRRSKKTAVKTSLMDLREWVLLVSASLGLSVIPLIYVIADEPRIFERPFAQWPAWLGTAVMIGALWLFRRSHKDLGRNWSATLKLREQHGLVTGGVYSQVRHPMYSSFFLLGVAQLLLLPNWFAGAVGLIGAALLFVFRIQREEAMMLESFGDDYRAYMARTARIIPRVFI
ncbi:MAG TPA: protein-S-isoprenylcysteine O-methyltransferase [Pseudolabrys sp.]|nr:protein-S-isoprenylcysteine O-methyltransferase [Pseudolabrys sp.]